MAMTISPLQALRGREWAVVAGDPILGPHVYDLYVSKDTAERICRDLNERYGKGSYHVAHVEL